MHPPLLTTVYILSHLLYHYSLVLFPLCPTSALPFLSLPSPLLPSPPFLPSLLSLSPPLCLIHSFIICSFVYSVDFNLLLLLFISML